MKIEHLYYFLTIVNAKSINKAAHRLFISQQHLSRIVTTLEDSLHVQLLRRNATGIELTEKGKIFLQFAEKIVDDYREMQSYFYLDALPALDTNETLQGDCEISFPFFFSLFLNDFMQKFNSRYPKINIKYFENLGMYSAEEIFQSDQLYLFLDIPERETALAKDNISAYFIGETSTSICINRASSLSQNSIITKQDIQSMPQTAFPQNDWNDTILNSSNILFTSSNIYQHLDSVVQNQSVFIVPTYIQSGIYANYPDICLLPFENYHTFPIYILHSKHHTLTNAEKAVIRFLGEYIQMLNQLQLTAPNQSSQ